MISFSRGESLKTSRLNIDGVAELEYAGVADEIRAQALISYDGLKTI